MTAKTVMSASNDVDFVLRSTWNVVTEKGRRSVDRNEMIEHGILCALVLTEKGKVVVKKYESEADKHKSLKDWLEMS